ncbi:MAG: hypothetical protein CFE45_34585 [Burkholderiales bacterium PBB5]|nr:MAG: hypothetical protein CFE45_34585 [Burkholderiales bacterium PBB5]
MRRTIAQAIAQRLANATGPACLLMPLKGIEQWDQPGEPLHDAEGLQAFTNALREAVPPGLPYVELDTHINDAAFCDAALQVFDDWVAKGLIAKADA